MTLRATDDAALLKSIDVTVRREKALDFSGCNSRPGTGSLHPVAIETIVEATKLSELSMERVARRLRERAGHDLSDAEQVPKQQLQEPI